MKFNTLLKQMDYSWMLLTDPMCSVMTIISHNFTLKVMIPLFFN